MIRDKTKLFYLDLQLREEYRNVDRETITISLLEVIIDKAHLSYVFSLIIIMRKNGEKKF